MSESYFEKADDFMRAAANTATFGAADYIAAYGNKTIFGGTAEQNITEQREYSKTAAERSPDVTRAGHIAGTMLAAELLSLGISGQGILLNPKVSATKMFAYPALAHALNVVSDCILGEDDCITMAPAPESALKVAPDSNIEAAPSSAQEDCQNDTPTSFSPPKTTAFSEQLVPRNEMWQQYLPPLDLNY